MSRIERCCVESLDARGAGLPRQAKLLARPGHRGRGRGNGQAQRLGDHGHRVAGVGARPPARARHLRRDQPIHVGVVDHAALTLADRLENGLPRYRSTSVSPDLGRARIHVHGGHTGPQRTHDHPWSHLVPAGDQHRRVEGVGLDHHLDAVGDQFSGGQHVSHSSAGHRDHIGGVNDIELEWRAAGRPHAGLNRFRDRPQVNVLGRDLIPRVRHRDQGSAQLVGGPSRPRIPTPGEDPIQPFVPSRTSVCHGRDCRAVEYDCQQ